MSREQNTGQNDKIIIDNNSFENVANFEYFGRTVTNKITCMSKTASGLNSGNVCDSLPQNIL